MEFDFLGDIHWGEWQPNSGGGFTLTSEPPKLNQVTFRGVKMNAHRFIPISLLQRIYRHLSTGSPRAQKLGADLESACPFHTTGPGRLNRGVDLTFAPCDLLRQIFDNLRFGSVRSQALGRDLEAAVPGLYPPRPARQVESVGWAPPFDYVEWWRRGGKTAKADYLSAGDEAARRQIEDLRRDVNNLRAEVERLSDRRYWEACNRGS